jgi:uncharacterized OB-fold protein
MLKALAPRFSTWPDENPQLIGSQCGACSATTFPASAALPQVQQVRDVGVLLPAPRQP